MADPVADRFICWAPSMVGHVNRGSVTRHCNECLGEVWVAPSTFKYIKRNKIAKPVFWCVPCAGREFRRKGRPPIEMLAPTEEQLVEIAEELRRSKQ